MTLELPFPPSVNTYWRRVGNRTVLSKKGREYKATVAACVLDQLGPTARHDALARLAVTITAHPPDKRKRDLDNLPKGVLDSLAYAGVYDDDGQIDDLHIKRATPRKPGCIIVTITEANRA